MVQLSSRLPSLPRRTRDGMQMSPSRCARLKVLTTGGTLDDVDYTDAGNAPRRRQSVVCGVLRDARVTLDVEIDEIFFKDSRFITDDDREQLANRVSAFTGSAVVITHGTFTLAETARFLFRKALPKTVVLVGAMVPATRAGSDAPFNLGAAVMAAQVLPNGVYVVMNGRIFSANAVEKDVETGLFHEMSRDDARKVRRSA